MGVPVQSFYIITNLFISNLGFSLGDAVLS